MEDFATPDLYLPVIAHVQQAVQQTELDVAQEMQPRPWAQLS